MLRVIFAVSVCVDNLRRFVFLLLIAVVCVYVAECRRCAHYRSSRDICIPKMHTKQSTCETISRSAATTTETHYCGCAA